MVMKKAGNKYLGDMYYAELFVGKRDAKIIIRRELQPGKKIKYFSRDIDGARKCFREMGEEASIGLGLECGAF